MRFNWHALSPKNKRKNQVKNLKDFWSMSIDTSCNGSTAMPLLPTFQRQSTKSFDFTLRMPRKYCVCSYSMFRTLEARWFTTKWLVLWFMWYTIQTFLFSTSWRSSRWSKSNHLLSPISYFSCGPLSLHMGVSWSCSSPSFYSHKPWSLFCLSISLSSHLWLFLLETL